MYLRGVLPDGQVIAVKQISQLVLRMNEFCSQLEILEIVNLANDLLSPLVLPVIPERHDSIATEVITHEKLPEEWLKLLQQFEMDLLPVLMQICGSISNGPIPHKCLSVISKLMHFTRACKINSLLSVTNISRFLAGILARKDPQVLISALQIADTLMNKCPAIFSETFDSFKHSGLSVGSPPILIKVPTSSSDMFVGVKSAAQALKVSYSKYNPEYIDASSKELQNLKSLCFNLVTFDDQKVISKGSKAKEDLATPIISEILRTLIEGDYSTFEFIESGVVDAFLKYLSCGFHSNGNISDSMLSNDLYHEQAARRCKSFITVSLPLGLQDKKMAPMSILVKYLQSALSYLERFPVVLSHGDRSYNGYGHLSSGLSVLSRKSSAKTSEIGIVPPSARVLLAQEKNDTSSKRKGKTVLTQKEESGTHMRIDARKGAVDKGAQMKIDEESKDDISDNEVQDDDEDSYDNISNNKDQDDDEESNDDFSDNEDQDDLKGVNGHGSENKEGVRVGRLRQRNVRVSRDITLESIARVMEMDNNQRKYVLEVYFGEVDIELESTLEFYTFLVLELQKVGLEMWRLNNASVNSMMEVKEIGSTGNTVMAFDALTQAPCGLFPSSWPPNVDLSDGSTFKKIVDYFKLLGRVLATALQDKRPLDLSLSSAFYKLLLSQDLGLHDINSFDPELGKNLLRYQALVDVKLFPRSRGGNNEVSEIQFSENENANEDPDHDFTLPDYPFPENVYINNLKEYIDYIFDFTAGSGIKRQLEALRAGFNELSSISIPVVISSGSYPTVFPSCRSLEKFVVFDISSLQIFSAKELEYMLCN
ncbi:hypothetical protein AgCh_026904 [Apium graveolens]